MTVTISFIIASFNDDSDIDATLQSILTTAHKDDQIIVADGHSSDKTVEVATLALSSHCNSIVLSEPDSGIYDAWNKSIERASGDWIAFLGCGDLLHPEYRDLIEVDLQSSTNNFIHMIAQFYDVEEGTKIKFGTFGKPYQRIEFINKMRICHVGALHHKTLFEDGLFSTEYHCVSDYYFLLCRLDQLKPKFIDRTMVDMKVGGISMNSVLPIFEEFKMKKKLGSYNLYMLLIRSGVATVRFYVRKIYKRCRF